MVVEGCFIPRRAKKFLIYQLEISTAKVELEACKLTSKETHAERPQVISIFRPVVFMNVMRKRIGPMPHLRETKLLRNNAAHWRVRGSRRNP